MTPARPRNRLIVCLLTALFAVCVGGCLVTIMWVLAFGLGIAGAAYTLLAGILFAACVAGTVLAWRRKVG